MYRIGIPALDLWVKQGTGDVPDDGKYYVVHGNQITASFRHLSAAVAEYKNMSKGLGHSPRPREPVDSLVARREDLERDLDRTAEYWAGAVRFRTGGKLRYR